VQSIIFPVAESHFGWQETVEPSEHICDLTEISDGQTGIGVVVFSCAKTAGKIRSIAKRRIKYFIFYRYFYAKVDI